MRHAMTGDFMAAPPIIDQESLKQRKPDAKAEAARREKAKDEAEAEIERRLEENRLAEDAFEDEVEDAEQGRMDAEGAKADRGD